MLALILCLRHPDMRRAAIRLALDSCCHLWSGSLRILSAIAFTRPSAESFQCQRNYPPPLLLTPVVFSLLRAWAARLQAWPPPAPTSSGVWPRPQRPHSSASAMLLPTAGLLPSPSPLPGMSFLLLFPGECLLRF